MKKLTDLINEVKELDKNATPGPWVSEDSGFVGFLGQSFFKVLAKNTAHSEDTVVAPQRIELENADLIAAYRTACPKLAQVCEVMRHRLQDLATHGPRQRAVVDLALAEVDKIMREKE